MVDRLYGGDLVDRCGWQTVWGWHDRCVSSLAPGAREHRGGDAHRAAGLRAGFFRPLLDIDARPSSPPPHRSSLRRSSRRCPPPGRCTRVEPTVYAAITPDAARASNALVPLATGRIAPARPFTFTGTPADRSTALTCLTAAVLYEAGDDPEGERAVAQVVLNRLRHPVFPKTVCGVIFQGADRKTGCQFTFACAGSLDRPPNPDAWKHAKAIADAALSGTVFKPVGTATHYHTDWVVPYWRDTLTKIAIVHTQIFYLWPGAWGLPPAFVGVAQAPEQLDPRLVPLADPVPLSIDPAILSVAPDAITAPGGLTASGLTGQGCSVLN
jgi:spore germination cell wall hydrolase CwlJ-like protein